jgi:hypothetical protein
VSTSTVPACVVSLLDDMDDDVDVMGGSSNALSHDRQAAALMDSCRRTAQVFRGVSHAASEIFRNKNLWVAPRSCG